MRSLLRAIKYAPSRYTLAALFDRTSTKRYERVSIAALTSSQRGLPAVVLIIVVSLY